jgi:transcriptional regulator with XRE-family HTH domain
MSVIVYKIVHSGWGGGSVLPGRLVRVGNKVISTERIRAVVERILSLRSGGMSQQDVADAIGVDRSFISRLESLGEIRKGRTMAIIGFPVANVAEIKSLAEAEGVEFTFLLTEKERWDFLHKKTGLELFNEIMALVAKVRGFDIIITLGSDQRLKFLEALIGKETLPIELGASPITKDVYVDPNVLRRVVRELRTLDSGEGKV